MDEAVDLTTSFQTLVDAWHEHGDVFNYYLRYLSPSYLLGYSHPELPDPALHPAVKETRRRPIDPTLLSVRPSVCVVGRSWQDLQTVKSLAASQMSDPMPPLESLHVKRDTDVADGALLVPKVILVGRHMPGKKLIDDVSDEGQLDAVYDEVVRTGADVFVVYLGLPTSIYKPLRHMVYHPKMIDVVFPDQRVMRQLAEDNLLVTCVEGQKDFTLMQKNVLKEWLEKPVGEHHPVYQAADYLSSVENETYGDYTPYTPDVNFFSESEVVQRSGGAAAAEFHAAEEHHPLATKSRRKEKRRLLSRLRSAAGGKKQQQQQYRRLPEHDLIELTCEDDSVMTESGHHGVEMNVYTHTTNPAAAFSQLSV